eukprot:7309235-Pyramimonas_sp.AAC.2
MQEQLHHLRGIVRTSGVMTIILLHMTGPPVPTTARVLTGGPHLGVSLQDGDAVPFGSLQLVELQFAEALRVGYLELFP